MKKKILLIVLCVACTASFAQTRKRKKRTPAPVAAKPATPPPSTALTAQPPVDSSKRIAPLKPFDRPLDGFYKKNDILNAKVVPYASIREADVSYSKRVWREIDLREKMNQYLISPKARLIDLIMSAVANGELTAYDASPDAKVDPDGDSFARPLTPEGARNKMADSSSVDIFDKTTGDKIGSHMVAGELVPDSIVKFRIKEDWIFDRQRSIFEPRIIGLAPMVKIKISGQEDTYQPAFWIYFPDARQIFANKEVVSKNSDATGLSFDDVFMKRIFTSYIVKQSNDKDERIQDYAQGIDKLYESEKIKKKLMDYELDLWKYGQ